MVEFQPFNSPILTPTTKADVGHDENITLAEIVNQGLATPEELEQMIQLSHNLFDAGQATAEAQGLLLADTKHEFGYLPDGRVIAIDEVHTPDSSRYFPLDQYLNYLNGATTERPEQLSKEFVREWLKAEGFTGQDGQMPPNMSQEFIAQVSDRYIDLFERMLGHAFEPAESESEVARLQTMHENLVGYLEKLAV